jgi:phosphatidylinositol alpha-1,6-mannosyltransferase
VSSASPHILLVSEVFPPAIGGSGVLLDNVYRRLQCPVTVLADGDPLQAERRGAMDIQRVSMRAPDWGLLRPACARRHFRLARAIRRLTQTGSLIHCARGLPEGLGARLARVMGGAPYVCWTHGEELGFASTSRELTILMRRVLAGAHAVLANSVHSKRLLTERWELPDRNVHVVYPGVDAERFRAGPDGAALRARLGRPGDIVFLSVGRLQRRKGHDSVIAALPEVRRALPAVRYAIVGDGPERASLEEQARKAGVADITFFAGAVPEDELPQWYRAADVFVLPNRLDGVDFEGFGIVLLEAAASGLPVIGGRSGGVPETMIDGQTGWLVEPTDRDELVRRMSGLAGSQELRARFGTAGRDRVIAEFSWPRAAARVAEIDHALRQGHKSIAAA